MLKSILNLKNVQVLNKNQQKHIKGGNSFMCLVMCGSGDGNIPIYDNGMTMVNGELVYLPEVLQEEIGCFCTQ